MTPESPLTSLVIRRRLSADARALIRVAAPARSETAHVLQAEEALLKAEIADLEARNARQTARQTDKSPPDTATPLKSAREAVAAARKAMNDDAAGYPPLTPVYPATSTGRRRASAPLDHASR